MALSPDLLETVRRALEENGLGRRIERVTEVGGGCINHGARLDTDVGAAVFLKWNPDAPAGMFDAEADGLTALAAPEALRVPAPIAWSDDFGRGGGPSWLLIEYVPAGRTSARSEERLARGLAAVHARGHAGVRARGMDGGESTTGDGPSGFLPEGAFGWRRDNWIGSLPQANEPLDHWGDFWRERRLRPQLERARARGRLAHEVFDDVLDLAAGSLADVERPELVHGDLWSGNWFASEGGEPVVIDPAVYLGHGEVDLAMSELFGGFGSRFYEVYREVHGITDAYAAYRRELYQLYYLLVHANLFGTGYEAGCLRAARGVVAALG